jgi:hypothetical protein
VARATTSFGEAIFGSQPSSVKSMILKRSDEMELSGLATAPALKRKSQGMTPGTREWQRSCVGRREGDPESDGLGLAQLLNFFPA